jgi:hypothetical protein
LTLLIDGNNNGSVIDGKSDGIIYLSSGDGKNYVMNYLDLGEGNIMLLAIYANLKVATTIGTSPNSSNKHRILEFSFPLKPVLNWSGNDFGWAPKDSNGNYVIGFGSEFGDSYGNYMSISSGPQNSVTQLTFGSIPVSEPADTLLVGGVALAAASPHIYSRVKNRRLTRREFLHLPNKNNLS